MSNKLESDVKAIAESQLSSSPGEIESKTPEDDEAMVQYRLEEKALLRKVCRLAF